MKNLPKVTPYKPTENQMSHFSRWLAEYETDRVMAAKMAADEAVELSDIGEIPIRSPDTDIQEGQIRLFRPSVLPSQRMLYVAVLKDWEPGEWLIAPFSEFTAPALPAELLLEREELHLKVVCAWNTRTALTETLEQSWNEAELTADEHRDIWAVFRYAMTGAPLPKALVNRTGPHVLRANDPRVAYQQKEAALLNAVDAIGVEAAREAADAPPEYSIIRMSFDRFELEMAADDGADRTMCICAAAPEENLQVAKEAPPAKQCWAVCEAFDPLVPGSEEEIFCEWFVDGIEVDEITAAYAYIENVEKPIGRLLVEKEGRRWHLMLTAFELPPDAPTVRRPREIRLAVFTKKK